MYTLYVINASLKIIEKIVDYTLLEVINKWDIPVRLNSTIFIWI